MVEFESGSSPGPFDEQDLRTFTEWLQREYPLFTADSEWLSVLRITNGGVPKKNLIEGRMISRFYHFGNFEGPLLRSSAPNIHSAAWDSEAFDLLLMPFAGLVNGDLLCFDHREIIGSGAPIVIWLHEESEEDSPVTVRVADSFREFVAMLKHD